MSSRLCKKAEGAIPPPFMFVFKGTGKRERFFVGVKDRDLPIPNQEACFPVIEDILKCDIKLVRIRKPSHPVQRSIQSLVGD